MVYNVGPFLSLFTSQNKMFLSFTNSISPFFSAAPPPSSLLLPESPYNRAPAGERPRLHIKVSRLTPILIPQNVLRCEGVFLHVCARYPAQHKHCQRWSNDPVLTVCAHLLVYTNVFFDVLNPLISIVPYKVYLPISPLSIYLAYHSEGAKLLCKQCLYTR